MSTKQTTSFKTTTNLQTGQSQSFRTTSKTSSRTNIGKGGLGAIGRLGIIAITILGISVGTSLNEFTTSDLIETAPNYQLKNQFVPIDDPLNTINYVQYGSGVFNRLHDFVIGFSDLGLTAKSYYDSLTYSYSSFSNFNIFNSLENAQDHYDTLTQEEKDIYAEVYDSLTFLLDWFYYSPAQLSA
jgi:hypothetical protein